MHIQKRRRKWYAILNVPKDVAPILDVPNNRFVKSLKTESRAEAQAKVWPIIDGWKLRIDRARRGLHGDAVDQEAARWRVALESADPETREAILDALGDRANSMVEASALAGEIGRPGETQWSALPGHEDAKRLVETATGQRVLTAELVEAYLGTLSKRAKPMGQKTINMVRVDLGKLSDRFPTLDQVNAVDVEDWLTELAVDRARNTVARVLSACRGYWKYLQKRAKVVDREGRPFEVTFEGGYVLKKVGFTPAEVVGLVEGAEAKGDHDLADLTRLAMYTGARINELCSLKVADVDLAKGSFKITAAKTDSGIRELPIHPALLPVMERLIATAKASGCAFVLSGLKANAMGDRSHVIGKRAGTLKVSLGHGREKSFHSIRHTVSTLLDNAGVLERVISAILGHTVPGMSLGRYSDGSNFSVKAEALEKVSYPPHT